VWRMLAAEREAEKSRASLPSEAALADGALGPARSDG
jgi:hypothetical protein